jgi:hypothetical protein
MMPACASPNHIFLHLPANSGSAMSQNARVWFANQIPPELHLMRSKCYRRVATPTPVSGLLSAVRMATTVATPAGLNFPSVR